MNDTLIDMNLAAGRSTLTSFQRDAIFDRRAETLAAASSGDVPGDTFDALVFCVGGEWFAFPGTQIHEVRLLSSLTALPGTPSFIAGLINVRGRIVAVLDLRPLLGLPPVDEPAMSVVLVSHHNTDIGVLASGRPTVHQLRETDLTEPPAGMLAGLDPSCVRGVTPGMVLVLDAERLLSDPRLVVQHDVLPKA